MRISYPPIVVGTVVAVALAAGVAGAQAQSKGDLPAHKADAQVVDGGALAVRKPVKPVDPVVIPVEGVDKGGWSNDPYLT
jgi:hypothetical protein